MLESYELTDNARNPNWEERLTSLESTVQDLAKVVSDLTGKDKFLLEGEPPTMLRNLCVGSSRIIKCSRRRKQKEKLLKL
jgi:hypothetical protein